MTEDDWKKFSEGAVKLSTTYMSMSDPLLHYNKLFSKYEG
jgi:hypothetical protein